MKFLKLAYASWTIKHASKENLLETLELQGLIKPIRRACLSHIQQPHYYAFYIAEKSILSDKNYNKYINFIVKAINQVTPCEIYINSKGALYVIYKAFGSYKPDLILTGFIRYIWNCPYNVKYEIFKDNFIDKILNSKVKKFYFKNLMLYNRNLGASLPSNPVFNHSNVCASQNLNVWSAEFFKNHIADKSCINLSCLLVSPNYEQKTYLSNIKKK